MSIRTLTRVWTSSSHSGTHLLMMLAIADFADDGGNAYPAVATLATKCRMSPRNANLILAELRSSGELEVRPNEGPKGTNRYRIVVPIERIQNVVGLKNSSGVRAEENFRGEGVFSLTPTSPTPEASFPKPLKPNSDEPSLNRQESSGIVPKAGGTEHRTKTRKASGVTLTEFLNAARDRKESAISGYLPVWDWASKVGIPRQWIEVAWRRFRAQYEEDPNHASKRYADWRRVFLNALKQNWSVVRLWTVRQGNAPQLNQSGELALRELEAIEEPT